MSFYLFWNNSAYFAVCCWLLFFTSTLLAQDIKLTAQKETREAKAPVTENKKPLVISILPSYYDQTEGVPLAEIIKHAFENNGEIKIARLEVDKARARLVQSRLRSNPTLEVEKTSGRVTGSAGEGELSVGVSVPIDIYNQRRQRIDAAQAEITLREAEIAVRQRELASQVFVNYAEALATLREVQVLEQLLELDLQTIRFVQIRVNEGDTAPLELQLLQTEVERLRSRRQLSEGKLQASLSRLKFYAGIPYEQPLKLREEITTANFKKLPKTLETSITVALQTRPEIKVAELEQQLASAGLRLVRAQSRPEVTAYTKYTQSRSVFNDTPVGAISDRDRTLTFGVAIGIPIFNKNQGAKAEAEIAIRQSQERRLFSEQVIKNEVVVAFQRMEAASRALLTLERDVLPRSRQNIEIIRQVYEIGELKITDLIAEQRRLLDANRDLTETLTERYRAQADLFIALGIELEN